MPNSSHHINQIHWMIIEIRLACDVCSTEQGTKDHEERVKETVAQDIHR